MARLFSALFALSLTACAPYWAGHKDGYIGHPVSEVVLKLGPPTTRIRCRQRSRGLPMVGLRRMQQLGHHHDKKARLHVIGRLDY